MANENRQPAQAQPAPAQAAQKGEAEVGQSGAKVTVACKMPNGIRIRAYRMVDTTEPVFGGGRRASQIAEPVSDWYTVFGTAVPFGHPPRVINVAGYALTPNIPQDVWLSWLADNKGSPIVKNGLVYAHEDTSTVEAWAKERGALRSGLEPWTPDGDPRAPRPNNANVDPVTVEEEQRKRRSMGA